MSPQSYWNILYRYVIVASILLALAGVFLAFMPKMKQYSSYQETKAALEADIRAKDESIKELRLKQERFNSDKYFVQQIAHEIGFAHEGETIYQFSESAPTNTKTGTGATSKSQSGGK